MPTGSSTGSHDLVILRTLITLATLFAVNPWGCSRGPQIEGPSAEGAREPEASVPSESRDHPDASSGIQADAATQSKAVAIEQNASAGTPVASNGGSSAPGEIAYPTTNLRGTGTSTCDGDVYPTTATAVSELTAERFKTTLTDAQIRTDSSLVQGRANEEIRANLDSSVYERVTEAERVALKGAGFDYASYALFVKSATKPKGGHSFTFDKPLPVFFWPGAISRYDDLVKNGPKSWSAKVSGTRSFSVKVTLSFVSQSGSLATLRLETLIPEDVNRSLYEMFPLPREAVYTIDTSQAKMVRVKNTNWFFGDQNCDDRLEQVVLTYDAVP